MLNALGVDVSFYQDKNDTPQKIDFLQMRQAGAEFVILRVGQNVWVDEDFEHNWTAAKVVGLPRGSYWFYDSRIEPTVQADLWAKQFQGDFGELPLFADFEEEYHGLYGEWQHFKMFLERIKKLAVNHEIGIYTGYLYWQERVVDRGGDLAYFKQFPLWIANYETSAPAVPKPWSSEDWLFWQWTNNGNGSLYGVESKNIDMNFFNGDVVAFRARFKLTEFIPPPAPLELPIQTHRGVSVHVVQRFGTKCLIHVIDPVQACVFVTRNGFSTVGRAVVSHGAQIGFNGSGWPNVQTAGHRANEIWVSDGQALQSTAIDNRGFIAISKTGKVTVHENAQNIAGLWNAFGFDRILGWGGEFNVRINDTFTKDARTGAGVTGEGMLIVLSAEGNDVGQHGLTFPEMWSVLKEFGAVAAGNCDGGSSSTCVNLKLSPDSLIRPSDGVEASVINHVLIFAGDGVSPPPPPIGEKQMTTYKVITGARFRSAPTTTTKDAGASSVAGNTFESDTTQADTANPLIQMVKHPNGLWLPLQIGEKIYNAVVAGPVVIPPIVAENFVITVSSLNGIFTVTVNGVTKAFP